MKSKVVYLKIRVDVAESMDEQQVDELVSGLDYSIDDPMVNDTEIVDYSTKFRMG
jgi:hypothetical protein